MNRLILTIENKDLIEHVVHKLTEFKLLDKNMIMIQQLVCVVRLIYCTPTPIK